MTRSGAVPPPFYAPQSGPLLPRGPAAPPWDACGLPPVSPSAHAFCGCSPGLHRVPFQDEPPARRSPTHAHAPSRRAHPRPGHRSHPVLLPRRRAGHGARRGGREGWHGAAGAARARGRRLAGGRALVGPYSRPTAAPLAPTRGCRSVAGAWRNQSGLQRRALETARTRRGSWLAFFLSCSRRSNREGKVADGGALLLTAACPQPGLCDL
eukprot:scaffold2740_cov418-Prasinococcus_capsulatus_cf.AAC.14